jgi:hypothetical protein
LYLFRADAVLERNSAISDVPGQRNDARMLGCGLRSFDIPRLDAPCASGFVAARYLALTMWKAYEHERVQS